MTRTITTLSVDIAFNIINRVRVEPAGCGTCHGALHPSIGIGTHYLALCGIKNEVVVYSLIYGSVGIEFTRTSSISTTLDPATQHKDIINAGSGELVVPGLDDIYVSNRMTGEATDRIAHLKSIPSTGTLQFVHEISSSGLLPCMMVVSDTGGALLVAMQDGPLGVSVLRRPPLSSLVTD
ncbi:unnamed protein product [Clonostachys rosea f. rosea IK726]|uniref:Uncharacterized protein n=1 Tax=Clonostachys rosea f. rosea IK726 TaxID=1349383 RepID=A0ACA9US39_BIOOC|nr:unnamed protein product [Clonostachys rosea f. rosea IK726]